MDVEWEINKEFYAGKSKVETRNRWFLLYGNNEWIHQNRNTQKQKKKEKDIPLSAKPNYDERMPQG